MDLKGKKVLLIDTNPAVHALAALALGELGIAVETIADATKAVARLAALAPDLVLCAHPLKDNDGLSLIKELKAQNQNHDTRYVVLAPSSTAPSFTETARNAGVDRVIIKPFKSGQLREIVAGLLNNEISPTNFPQNALLVMRDRYLEKLLRKYLEHYNTGAVLCSSLEEAAAMIAKGRFLALILSSEVAPDFAWCAHKQAIPTFLIHSAHDKVPTDIKKNNISPLARPLSVKKLTDSLLALLNPQATKDKRGPAKIAALSPAEQARAASQISAAIFEQLLLEPALKNKNWEKVARVVFETTSSATKNMR